MKEEICGAIIHVGFEGNTTCANPKPCFWHDKPNNEPQLGMANRPDHADTHEGYTGEPLLEDPPRRKEGMIEPLNYDWDTISQIEDMTSKINELVAGYNRLVEAVEKLKYK